MKADLRAATAGLFERSRLPMWLYGQETLSILGVNDAAIQYYGYSRAAFLAMTAQQLHPPEERSSTLDAMLMSPVAAKSKETWRHMKKDGTVVHVEISRILTRVESESAYLVTASDASSAKKSELLCRMLMDAVPSSVLLLDEDLRVVLTNRNFLEKSRQTAGQTIGKQLAEVFPEVIVAEMGLEEQVRTVFRNNEATRGRRLTYRAPGVPIRIYYYSVVPVPLGSRVDHVLLLMDDVTEQMRMSEEIRQMERHLASIVESATDIVLSTDTKGNILTWNKAAHKISGYSFEEVRSRPFSEYCDEPAVRRFLLRAPPRESSCMSEGALKTKDGHRRSVSWVLSEMTGDGGRTAGFVIVGRDLTEQRKLEMQIRESQKLAALGVMARGIAHEIRTPLTIASSAAQFLSEEDVTPAFQRECAEKVYSGIRKASAIIENLLRFAHPTTNLNQTPVDLQDIVKAALHTIENQAKAQNIAVRTRRAPRPCQVLGISGLLEQVFVNLFLNAMNAMPNGGTLDVSAARDGRDVLLHVSDTGSGIPPEDLDKLYDPFFTKAAPGKGTGLGLSICYSIVDQHKGSISVASQIGKGSTFTVRMPLASPMEEAKR